MSIQENKPFPEFYTNIKDCGELKNVSIKLLVQTESFRVYTTQEESPYIIKSYSINVSPDKYDLFLQKFQHVYNTNLSLCQISKLFAQPKQIETFYNQEIEILYCDIIYSGCGQYFWKMRTQLENNKMYEICGEIAEAFEIAEQKKIHHHNISIHDLFVNNSNIKIISFSSQIPNDNIMNFYQYIKGFYKEKFPRIDFTSLSMIFIQIASKMTDSELNSFCSEVISSKADPTQIIKLLRTKVEQNFIGNPQFLDSIFELINFENVNILGFSIFKKGINHLIMNNTDISNIKKGEYHKSLIQNITKFSMNKVDLSFKNEKGNCVECSKLKTPKLYFECMHSLCYFCFNKLMGNYIKSLNLKNLYFFCKACQKEVIEGFFQKTNYFFTLTIYGKK